MRTLASSRRSAINKIARIMVTFKLLHPFKGSFCKLSWAIQNFSWRIVYQSKCLHSHWGVKKWGGTIYQNFAHIHSNSSFCTQPNVLSDFSKGEFKHSRVHNRIVPLLASPPVCNVGHFPSIYTWNVFWLVARVPFIGSHQRHPVTRPGKLRASNED